MMIGFKMFREKFTSEVTLHSPDRIDVVYDRGPFRYLTNHWRFETDQRGLCVIDFYIDFEFRSRTLQALIGKLFNEAVQRMVNAFARRAGATLWSRSAPRAAGGRQAGSRGLRRSAAASSRSAAVDRCRPHRLPVAREDVALVPGVRAGAGRGEVDQTDRLVRACRRPARRCRSPRPPRRLPPPASAPSAIARATASSTAPEWTSSSAGTPSIAVFARRSR